MQDLTKILSKLTPEKRLLLEQKVLNDPEAFNAFPLSFSQRRLWFLNQLEPSSTAYNIPFAIEISGSLNIDILEKSINKIVERHEILRSVIISVKETPLQFINKQLNIRINEIDLSHLQNITDNSEINDKIKEINNSIFDLAIGPLFKCTLFKLDDNKFIFHVLMHHIISDGWSVGIFISEFSEIYNSLLNNAKPYVPELKIQYADYAKWQSEWSNSQDYQKQLDYWKNEFSNIPEPLDLPFDFQRPKIKKYNGSTSIFKLSIPDAESIGEIVKSSGTSMFMFFLSVLKVLLYKYSNSNDISIGTPIANRQKGEIQNLLGFFVNTLVIRNKIYSSRTFYDLLNNVRDKVLNSFENQEIPFETIIEQLHPDRNMGITPLFQVMFSYQKDPTSEINIENLKITPYSVENDKSKFDLSFAISETSKSEFSLSVEYDTDLFTENTIIRFVESFQGILNQVTIDSRKKISDISVLTNLDFELLRKLNDTEYSFPRTENLIQLFERNLNSYENNIAAVYENTTISYKELNERANKIARYLLKRGVRKDSIVPIIFNRSIDSIIAILSVWKAGAAYLPLVPSYPKDRIKQILDECKAKCIISNSLSVNAFDDIVSDVVLIDKNWKEIDGESSSNLSISIDPYNLSYVIYTSGSTGRPKGVMINHKSAINLAFSLRKIVYHDVKDHLKISLNAPLLFDASVQQILQLCFGDMLHIIPEETRLDSEKLLDFIRKNKLDVFDCVPTQLKFLIEEGFLDKDHWVPSKLLPGGEAIDEITWDAIRKFENSQFYNMYGPTECTVDPTICKINAETLKPSIGRPILNVHHYILNEDFEQVPIKVPGELYISGDCLSRGYYEKADLTAEKFIPDPFSKKPGSRMYSTGDKVKLNEDGNLEYLERVDDQIKLRGFRIELGEIDSALSQFEEIKQSVTILKKESKDIARIVSYCILKEGNDENSEKIITSLSKKLPDYMVPSEIIFLEDFPLLPNSKIDKKALMNIEFAGERNEIILPNTATQKIIVKIFTDLLQLDKEISIKDNFFDLGGHSLLATRLISRIRDSFNIELPLKIVFEHPNVLEISAFIDDLRKKPSTSVQKEIGKADHSQPIPLSFAQERIWFLNELEPNNTVYNIPMVFTIYGELNVNVFERTISEIIKRHEILRTSIKSTDGKAYLNIENEPKIILKYTDLIEVNNSDWEERSDSIIKEDFNRPFDISTSPLLRFNLIKVGVTKYIFSLNVHHIISDGWSTGIFINEFVLIYSALLEDKPVNLPELEIQYSDYAYWQRNYLKGKILDNLTEFWKKKLKGIPASIELPFDNPRPPVQTFNGAIKEFIIGSEEKKGLVELSNQNSSTLFMTMLAIFYVLLYRYSNQSIICVGTPVANRNRSEIESLIGLFINTLVIKNEINGNQSFIDVLKSIKGEALESFSHQDLPFEKIVDLLNIERNAMHSPIFQVMFTLQNESKNIVEIPGLKFEEYKFQNQKSKFDLNLTISELRTGELKCGLEFNTDLFSSATIEQIINSFINITSQVLHNPDLKVSSIDLLGEYQENSLLEELNVNFDIDTPHDFVHKMFEKTALKYPESNAVIFEQTNVSYAELNSKSNQLAHYLLQKGVGKEVFVGIYLDRSIEMLIAVLGILKTGAAYVPIDTSYPEERINFIVKDTKLKFIITDVNLESDIKLESIKKLLVKDVLEKSSGQINVNPDIEIFKENLAYVIYTSGSTGIPKGTQITHEGFFNYINWCLKSYPVNDGNGSVFHSTLAFDATITSIFPSLVVGKTVVVLPDKSDIDELAKALVKFKDFSTIKITPAHLELLSNQIKEDEASSITRSFIIGGENLTSGQINFWQKNAPDTLLFNEYGPTETVVGCIVYEASKWKGNGSVPIGKVIPNLKIYVLDRFLNPIAKGIPGELYIGGKGLARGYLGLPQLTAEKFIPDPFCSQEGERIYKTGDIVKILHDGNLIFLNRIDDQVKIRGYRIELGEIQKICNDHQDINESIFILKENTPGVKMLIGYIISKDQKKINTPEIKDYLSSRLPNYMVPHQIIQIDSFPLTSSGKVDKKALPDPSHAKVDVRTKYEKPNTEKEIILCRAVEEVLGIKKVGIHDNFFELGGDSIIGIQVISKIKQAGYTITPIQLFQYQTINQLASVAKITNIIKAEQGLVTGKLKAIPIQYAFFETNFENPNHWNQSLFFKVTKRIEKEILFYVVKQLSEHHDALRLRVNDENLPEMFIDNEFDERVFEYVELTTFPGDSKIEIERICNLYQRSLNIKKGPIFKVVYFDLGDQDGRILIIVHHLAIDGVSWRIILEDLQMLLSNYGNKDYRLPDKTSSIKEWGKVLSEISDTKAIMEEFSFWLDKAENYQNNFSPDIENGINSEDTINSYSISLEKDKTRQLLTEVNSKFNTKIDEILLTALLISYSKTIGKRSMLVHLEGHGRNQVSEEIDLSRTVGWFTTIYPVILELKKSISIEDSINVVKDQLREIPNQGFDYGLIRYLSSDEEIRKKLSVFDEQKITFNYLGQFDNILSADTNFKLADEKKGPERDLKNRRMSIIDVTGGIYEESLKMTFVFSKNLFRNETIEKFSQSFLKTLIDIIKQSMIQEKKTYAKSDFNLANLSDKKLDKIMSKLNKK